MRPLSLALILFFISGCGEFEKIFETEKLAPPLAQKAYLEAIIIQEVPLQFKPNHFDYFFEFDSTSLAIEVKAETNLEITIGDRTATRKTTLSLTNGLNLITISASHENLQQTDYRLTVLCHDPAYDILIEEVLIEDGELDPVWSKTTKTYFCGSFNTNQVYFSLKTRSDLAVVKLNGALITNNLPSLANLVPDPESGKEIVLLTIESQNGLVKDSYQFLFDYISPQKDARLESFNHSHGALTPSFKRDIFDYELKITTSSVSLNAHALHAGQSLIFDGATITNGQDLLFSDLSDGTVTNVILSVKSSDGTVTKDYKFKLRFDWARQYTSENYDFEGGIKAYLGELRHSLGDGPSYSITTCLTGVVTATEIEISAGYEKCFYLQDEDAGILVFTKTAESEIRPGNKVVINAHSGKYYYGMPEVTSYTFVEKQESFIPIFYQTGFFASQESLGKVFAYSGLILGSPDHFQVGSFGNDLYFHTKRSGSWLPLLEENQYGDFFGPISYSFGLYRMEISDQEQIR